MTNDAKIWFKDYPYSWRKKTINVSIDTSGEYGLFIEWKDENCKIINLDNIEIVREIEEPKILSIKFDSDLDKNIFITASDGQDCINVYTMEGTLINKIPICNYHTSFLGKMLKIYCSDLVINRKGQTVLMVQYGYLIIMIQYPSE